MASLCAQEKMNYKYNRRYAKAKKEITGQLSSASLKIISNKVNSIATDFDPTVSLLVHVEMFGENCIAANPNYSERNQNNINTYMKFARNVSRKFNIQQLFVYTKESFLFPLLKERNDWIQDDELFKSMFFNTNNICSGFVIIEPDGSYYVHYGEDYYSLIYDYFSQKK